MMKKLNEEQAWRVVAFVYGQRARGICTTLSWLRNQNFITRETYNQPYKRRHG